MFNMIDVLKILYFFYYYYDLAPSKSDNDIGMC